jgi:hypothetical protein
LERLGEEYLKSDKAWERILGICLERPNKNTQHKVWRGLRKHSMYLDSRIVKI